VDVYLHKKVNKKDFIYQNLLIILALFWSSEMLMLLSLPPHHSYQGGIDKDADLENIWKQRLENLIPLDNYWIKHQNR